MALVQAYRRNKTYTHAFTDGTLVFQPNEKGDVVCDVQDPAHVARLMVDAGLVVVVSLISPFEQERQAARSLFAPGEFVEVFVDTDLSVCEQRDAKGLYAKARRGELPMFTGIDSPYEAPKAPEIHLRCGQLQPAEALAQLVLGLDLNEINRARKTTKTS